MPVVQQEWQNTEMKGGVHLHHSAGGGGGGEILMITHVIPIVVIDDDWSVNSILACAGMERNARVSWPQLAFF